MVLKNVSFLLGIGWVLLGCSENPSSPAVEHDFVARSGEEIFGTSCASCHGMDGKLNASGAKDLSASSLDALMMTEIIQNGKNAMPPQNNVFVTTEELTNTIAYVKSLRE